MNYKNGNYTTREYYCEYCGVKKIAKRPIKYCSTSCSNKICKNRYLHGLSRTKFYSTFTNIKTRCCYKKSNRYQFYGGKGVVVEWKNFSEFKNDMYKSYLAHLDKYGIINTTIDRKDINGNYSKKNCRWSTIKEQANNKSNNIIIKYKGKKYTIKELSIKYNIGYACLKRRLKLWKDINRSIEEPVNYSKRNKLYANKIRA